MYSCRKMLKALLKYLLFLCIILAGNYGQLSANTPKESAFYTTFKSILESAQASSDIDRNDHSCTIQASTTPDSKNERREIGFAEKEIEEDEVDSSKKSFARNHDSLSNFYALSQGCYSLFIRNSLAFCKRFSYFTSHRWIIILQVFRI